MAWGYRPYRNKNWSHSSAIRPAAPAAQPAETARIDAVLASPHYSSLPQNKQDFIKSIKEQAGSKGLSDAQLNYLASIEKSLAPVDNSWFNATDSEMVRKREFTKNYYGATGYYSTIVAKMAADSAFVPDKALWDKMWENKFINARYKRFIDGHTLNIGDIAIGKFSYGGPHNGIIQDVTYNYFDGRWQYTFLTFEGHTMTFKDSEVKPAEKKARKPRSKKVK
jgi:hypothetical protein